MSNGVGLATYTSIQMCHSNVPFKCALKRACACFKVGVSKLFMRPAVIEVMDVPRKLAQAKAATVVAAAARRRVGGKVIEFLRRHHPVARALQLCLRSESGEKVPRKAEEVREHLADAEYKVEELSVVWKSALNPKLALALRRCAMQRQELISEWKLQSKMLNGEVEAAAKVMAVLEQKPELTKEAFLHLKTVTAEYGHATQTCG